MKKLLLLSIVIFISTMAWSQPPPPPPPLPLSGDAPIDTDILYFLVPAVLFAVYRLNKTKLKITIN